MTKSTPDSSRYFYADGYEARQAAGEPQKQLSKELFASGSCPTTSWGWTERRRNGRCVFGHGDPTYVELYEKVTGKTFQAMLRTPTDASRGRQLGCPNTRAEHGRNAGKKLGTKTPGKLSGAEAGGVMLHATDTVWGLACDATNDEAVQRMNTIKRTRFIRCLFWWRTKATWNNWWATCLRRPGI